MNKARAGALYGAIIAAHMVATPPTAHGHKSEQSAKKATAKRKKQRASRKRNR